MNNIDQLLDAARGMVEEYEKAAGDKPVALYVTSKLYAELKAHEDPRIERKKGDLYIEGMKVIARED